MTALSGFSVLLVDDHPLFREGLVLALAQHAPALRIHAVATCAEAAAHLRQPGQVTDLVLLDYRLPGEDGLRCALTLRQRFSAVAFAIMSGTDDLHLAQRVRDANLMGFFPKSLDVGELVLGLEKLAQGESYFSSGGAPLLMHQNTGHAFSPDDPLTRRQREILDMVARGATNKEIAQLLQIAPHTVKNHLALIFERLGASNRAQAAAIGRDVRENA
jgi:two-component system, NarL family, nitrate/nitrite response regulator NarL